MSFLSRLQVASLLVLIFSTLIIGCSSDGGDSSSIPDGDADQDSSEGGGPGICDRFDIEPCDCQYGKGYRRCLGDSSGFGECVCAIKNAVFGQNTVAIDEESEGKASLEGNRGLRVPVGAGLDGLSPGDIVVSWEIGLMGRVLTVDKQADSYLIDTEPCAITDAFEELNIEFNGKIPLASQLPEEAKQYFRENELANPRRMAKKDDGEGGDFELPAGISFTPSGKLDADIDILDSSHLDFEPNLYMKVDISEFDLNHLAIVPSIDLDLLLALRAEIDAAVSVTAEIEIFELILAAITGDPEIGPFRSWIGGGFELEVFFIIGALLELDAFIEVGAEMFATSSAYGGVLYSEDWDAPIWSDARSELRSDMTGWVDDSWHPVGEGSFDSGAQLTEFIWGAHGGLELYMQPKLALTFLRCGGPTIDIQPYGRFDAWVGDKNKLEAKVGIRGHAGGKLELFGEHTLWEESWELFDLYQIIWRYSWMLCGDGVRSLDCWDNLTDCEGGDCPLIDSGCGGTPEECDAGLFANIDGQPSVWRSEADYVGKPCIPPGQPGACTCGVGWVPVDSSPIEGFPHDWRWGQGNNWCMPSCGNGVVEPNEGEVCDHGGSPGCDGQCNEDCTKPVGLCGDGVKECYEECDDGNLDDCDGCSKYCTKEPGSGGCGDGYACGDEECDDGNEEDCDECHNDCTNNSGCGDGHVCGDEQCDDGNWTDCDECLSDCTLKTGCGDGHVCDGEQCDDGNEENCDECNTSCTYSGCGDGFQCGAELCDDGNTEGGDGCRHDCMGLEICGDGLPDLEAGEQCDDGNEEDCDECHSNCTLNLGECGDGYACGDEVCDDGNHEPGDGCSPNCMSDESCGNGIMDTAAGEVCDDGNTISEDGCSGDCLSDEVCGNGVVDDYLGEVCDDGNEFSGDGCRADCLGEEVCGDGLLDTGESCEDTSEDGIDLNCDETYPDCVDSCHHCRARCGDGILAPGEFCEINADGIDLNCSDEFPVCSEDCQGCDVDCSENVCGDGVLCPGEVCDDGNIEDCLGDCSADCQHEITGCGDTVICGDEVCDDGNTVGGDGCREDCLGLEVCGDGLLDVGEGCEDTTIDGIDEGCSEGEPDCVAECSACTPHCGDGVIGSGEICEDTSTDGIDSGCGVDAPVCSPDCHQCLTYWCGDGIVHEPEVCDGAPLDCIDETTNYLGERQCLDGCLEAGPCIPYEYCGDGVVNGNEVCDDADNDSCTRACSADCMHADLPSRTICGNSILECDEICDDGNTDSADGCSRDCLSDETCGNDYEDTAIGEQCDDGNRIGEDGCSADCRSDETCGNGVVDDFLGEVCDDGNTSDCIGDCAADCGSVREAPVCGDGMIDEDCEICENSDPSNESVDDGCNASEPNCNGCTECTADVCGDGIIGPSEDCDEGGSCSTDDGIECTTLDVSDCPGPDPICEPAAKVYGDGGVCLTTCEYMKCGDGVISGTEMCEDSDPSNTVIDEGCSAENPNCYETCAFCE